MKSGWHFVLIAAVAFEAAAMPGPERREACASRVGLFVGQMTGEERVGQLMMDSPPLPMLAIEGYHWWNEALHGVARAGLATVFPQAIGLAATFDPKLEKRIGDVVSTEARAKYNLFFAKGQRGIYQGLTLWSPNVNMFRDPRWGRGQETFGEDPYLTGTMGTAYVMGLQGDDPKFLKTAACAKHFAVHSGPEKLRHGFDAKVSKRDLAEYYLPAFRQLVVKGRVEAVMSAYSALNGVPCTANKWLLTDLLRGEWGFQGHVVSDVGAVRDIVTGHKFAKDPVEACKAAMAAGLDLCSEGTYACLREALSDGRLAAGQLVLPLTRLYTTRALLGMFDRPGATPWYGLGAKDIASDAHRKLALEAAEKSIVLVSNNGILPLDPETLPCLGVAGPLMQDEVALLGNYCGLSDAPVTCMSGLVREAGPSVRVATAGEIAPKAPVIACIGLTADDEGEEGCADRNAGGDRTAYALPKAQLDLLKRHKDAGRPVVAVVFAGSPVDLAPIVKLCDAVLLAWYPGEQGGLAVARTVFGRSNPSGRLPVTFPASYESLPPFEDYGLAGRTYLYANAKPAYPFGYGLSYSTFAYEDLQVRKTGEGEDAPVEVEVSVRNAKGPAGDEVVQVYVKSPEGGGDRRVCHLEGFARVSLEPGESKRVRFRLEPTQFRPFGEDGRQYLPKGDFTVSVGGGQPGFADCVSDKVCFVKVEEDD